ncbi:MAG: hypothetical protein H0X63_09840 [Flavobacteriales bacterium]|nr:hypothetical protein [Flavobacteriales bacterium]
MEFQELKDKAKQRQCNHSWVYKIMFDHTAKNVCEKCSLVVNQQHLPLTVGSYQKGGILTNKFNRNDKI